MSVQFRIAHSIAEDEHCSKTLLKWALRYLQLVPFAR